MIKIYTLGNPLLEEDRLALEVADDLKEKFKDVEFLEFDPIEDVEGDVWFMDVVEGLDDVRLLEEDWFEKGRIYTAHDLDLSQMLPMLKKAGKINSFKLIAVPLGMNKAEAVEKVARLLKQISTLREESGSHS